MNKSTATFHEGDENADEAVEMNASPVCFFCGREANPEDRPLVAYLAMVDDYKDGVIERMVGWTCHRSCVESAVHPDAPYWRPTEHAEEGLGGNG